MRLYLRSELKKRIPWSNTYLLELEKDGRFPRRIYLGPKTPAWPADPVDAFIEVRAAESAKSEAAA
jgi:predicted DNA-binding transcriptional regulator AlpA